MLRITCENIIIVVRSISSHPFEENEITRELFN